MLPRFGQDRWLNTRRQSPGIEGTVPEKLRKMRGGISAQAACPDPRGFRRSRFTIMAQRQGMPSYRVGLQAAVRSCPNRYVVRGSRSVQAVRRLNVGSTLARTASERFGFRYRMVLAIFS